MVARGRGRGAKAQAAKAKPVPQEEPVAPVDEEMSEPIEAGDGNGVEQDTDAPLDESLLDEPSEGAEGAEAADGEGADETAEGEGKAEEEKKEEKVEPGKVLIENLPKTYLFSYQEKLTELFSKHGEVAQVKRGPVIVTEQTTTPTLSAIVEFKNKDSLEKALSENGTVLDGSRIGVTVECSTDTAVLVGVPYEASNEYVRQLLGECGEISNIHDFSKTKYKIVRVTFQEKESVERALKLDRDMRINGFLLTVSKYRDDDEQKQNNANKNKRPHPQSQNRNQNAPAINNSPQQRNNFSNRGNNRGGAFNARGNFRGARGRGGFPARGGGAFPRGGFAGGMNNYMPPAFMQRPGGFMDGQRPNKRPRQM